jgi:hypothetical protein
MEGVHTCIAEADLWFVHYVWLKHTEVFKIQNKAHIGLVNVNCVNVGICIFQKFKGKT